MLKTTLTISVIALACLLQSGCNSSTARAYPAVSTDGLVQVDHGRARVNAIYMRQETDFVPYDSIQLLEPLIAFKDGWQETVNQGGAHGQITDEDMARMSEGTAQMLVEEFTNALQAGGYKLVNEAGPDVLKLELAVTELDVFAPDPNNTASFKSSTYTSAAGSFVLTLEVYDAVSGQVLARVIDRKLGQFGEYRERKIRTQQDNIDDARRVFGEWATALVEGLELVKTNKAVFVPREGSK